MSDQIDDMRLAALKSLRAIFEDESSFTSHEVRVSAAATLLHHTVPQSAEQWQPAIAEMLRQADEHFAAQAKSGKEV